MTIYAIGPGGPIGGSAQTALLQPGRPHAPLTIYNTGSVSVYLSSSWPTTTTDGIPLTAGSSIPWDEDLPLYAVCPTQTTITTSENSGIPFDAGAIAAQLNAQGLPQLIANAISISGAPPIDAFAGIGTPSQIMTLGSQSPIIDMRRYQSLFLTILTGTSVGARFDVTWYSDNTATVPIEQDSFYLGTGFITQFSMLAKGPYVQVGFNLGSGSCTFNAFGSYKPLQFNQYGCAGAGSANGTIEGIGTAGIQTWYGTLPASTAWTWQPDVVAGRNVLTLRYLTAASGTVASIARIAPTAGTLTVYHSETTSTTTAITINDELLLPPAPLEISLTPNNVAIQFRATLVSSRPFQ